MQSKLSALKLPNRDFNGFMMITTT